jgi:hypothetical protein
MLSNELEIIRKINDEKREEDASKGRPRSRWLIEEIFQSVELFLCSDVRCALASKALFKFR